MLDKMTAFLFGEKGNELMCLEEQLQKRYFEILNRAEYQILILEIVKEHEKVKGYLIFY